MSEKGPARERPLRHVGETDEDGASERYSADEEELTLEMFGSVYAQHSLAVTYNNQYCHLGEMTVTLG